MKSLTIQPINDFTPDDNKTVIITISDPTVAELGANNSHTATILDDDLPNWLTISDVNVSEGNSGSTDAVFTVALSPATTAPVTVNYSTADGTAHAAGDTGDYVAQSGTLNFAAGETEKTITVQVTGDNIYEAFENFFVNLTSPPGHLWETAREWEAL